MDISRKHPAGMAANSSPPRPTRMARWYCRLFTIVNLILPRSQCLAILREAESQSQNNWAHWYGQCVALDLKPTAAIYTLCPLVRRMAMGLFKRPLGSTTEKED